MALLKGNYQLVAATEDDRQWLEQLRRSVYRELFFATWGEWNEARHLRHCAECWDRGNVFRVEVGGVRVGMIQFFEEPGVVEVGEIQIDPSYQGRGIGSMLLRDTVSKAQARGKKVSLATGLKNRRAFSLYRRLGFEHTGQTDTHHLFEFPVKRVSSALPADLRSATVEDAADIVRVLRASRLRFLPYAPPAHSEAEDLEWARAHLLPAGGVTVATIDDGIVGVLATRRSDGVSWIDQLYIQPEYCGRGVGSQLMRFALTSLLRPVRLYTFQENRRAHRFYERFGFVATRRGDGSDNEEGRPDVLFELVDGITDAA